MYILVSGDILIKTIYIWLNIFTDVSGEVVTANHVSAEEGTYFVDQAGHYYYQAGTADGQQVMTVVSGKLYYNC